MRPDWHLAGEILWDLAVCPHVLRCRARAAFGADNAFRWVAPRAPERLRLLDAAPLRDEVDVTTSGFGYPTAPSTTRGAIAIDCGDMRRRIQVFGPRVADVDGGAFVISPPAAFERVPLLQEHAYGGVCGDVHYPRNPHGNGFVLADAHGQFALPLLEEANDLLVDERFLVSTPEGWWRQPLPATFNALGAGDFPRVLSSVVTPITTWHTVSREPLLPERATGDVEDSFDLERGSARYFANEVPMRSRLRGYEAGTPFVVAGCSPGGKTWSGTLPRPPAITLMVEGKQLDLDVRVQTLELATETREIFLTLGFDASLSRGFVPGIHKRIPIEVGLEGRPSASYPTPPTIKERQTQHKRSMP